jgi:GT2 family glycosyltransferase
MMLSTLAIVVLNYNTRDLLSACLRSIRSFAPDAQIVVVDNASTDHSVEAVREQFPEVNLIANSANVGFARGMNQGLQATTGPFILALNADTELIPTTLPALLAACEQLPRAGILAPVQYMPDPARPGELGSPLASAFPDPTLVYEAFRLLLFGDTLAARLRLGPWRRVTLGNPRAVDWVMGAALLFRRECLTAVSGFDETQFMYGEDWDICYRARCAGWQVYLVPAASILHHENASGKQAFGAHRLANVLRANLYFHEKHFGLTSRRALASLYLVGASLRLISLIVLKPVLAPDEFNARWRAWREQVRLAAHALM